jgi:hypothetical protein
VEKFSFYTNNFKGNIIFPSGQIVMSGLSGIRGSEITASNCVYIRSTVISKCVQISVAIADSSNLIGDAEIVNNSHVSVESAVQLSGAVTASRITPTVDGQASAYSWGTRALGTADDRSAYDMGGIDSTYIAAGYANKLICNEIASTSDTIMQPQYARVDLLTGATSYEIENICNIVLRY